MEVKIAVIGLGYVGLPLARLFATRYNTVGYDIHSGRIAELREGRDRTMELEDDLLKSVLKSELNERKGLYVTDELEDTKDCNFYIVTVPTPVDKNKRPNLTALLKASKSVGSVIKKGDTVIFESTVYPGA